MASVLKIAACVALGAALLLAIISTASNVWVQSKNVSKDFSYGIWKFCQGDCVDVKMFYGKYKLDKSGVEVEVAGWLKGVRAMEIMTIGACAAALAVVAIITFVKNIKLLHYTVLIAHIAAALFSLASCATFADKTRLGDYTKYAWGFFLVPVRIIVLILSAILFFLVFRKGGD